MKKEKIEFLRNTTLNIKSYDKLKAISEDTAKQYALYKTTRKDYNIYLLRLEPYYNLTFIQRGKGIKRPYPFLITIYNEQIDKYG